MSSVLKRFTAFFRRAPFTPLRFPGGGFELVGATEVLEEERFEHFKSGDYYPVKIGDVFASKYQIAGKLGFGVTSTVWLARDLQSHKHVALKVYTRGSSHREEFDMYRHMMTHAGSSHPGARHVRTALDMFVLPRAGGDHHCLVQKPMWDSFRDLLSRNPAHRFTEILLKAGLRQVFLALDYLHTECNVVHTDIKADNILLELQDDSVLEAFVQDEIDSPSPRKIVNGIDAPVYASRQFRTPRTFGAAVLGDFGSAVRGDARRNHDAQPNSYRSPEVMLAVDWSYAVDIWNVGVMIWDLFEGKHMFYGIDPHEKTYLTRAHLADVMGMLGPPPLELLQRGERSIEFFTADGQWKAGVDVPKDTSLELSEERLEGETKRLFLEFVRGMLQWRPEDRKTASQLLTDPWLNADSD